MQYPHNMKQREHIMDQKRENKTKKEKWEKPVLINLDVAAKTKTGAYGTLTDGTNTSVTAAS